MKRTLDFLLSGLALLVLSPLLIPVIVILRLTGEGEIFYGQQRVGLGGGTFTIYKFATMLKNSPNLPGGDITVGNDPRVLPIGRVLRSTKINELPQLFNILLGDMSIIGWRPLTPRVASYFPKDHWQAIKGVRPGLSGVGSIVFRDEEGLLSAAADRQAAYETAIVPYKSALEVWYAEKQSLLLDLKLVGLTVLALFNPKLDLGAYLPGLPSPPAPLQKLRMSVAKE